MAFFLIYNSNLLNEYLRERNNVSVEMKKKHCFSLWYRISLTSKYLELYFLFINAIKWIIFNIRLIIKWIFEFNFTHWILWLTHFSFSGELPWILPQFEVFLSSFYFYFLIWAVFFISFYCLYFPKGNTIRFL